MFWPQDVCNVLSKVLKFHLVVGWQDLLNGGRQLQLTHMAVTEPASVKAKC